MNRPVVVVSMAIWSPYGRGIDAFWNGLVNMQLGRKDITRFDVSHWVFRSKGAATIPEIPGEASGADRCAREIMENVVADALDELAAAPRDLSPYDVGLCLGSSHGGATARFLDFLKKQRGEPINPELTGSNTWLSSATFLSALAGRLGAQGPSALISTACASGTE